MKPIVECKEVVWRVDEPPSAFNSTHPIITLMVRKEKKAAVADVKLILHRSNSNIEIPFYSDMLDALIDCLLSAKEFLKGEE